MNAATGHGQATVRKRRARRPGLVKNRRIAIAVDEVEHQDLETAAREDGLTVSAFVANRALAAARHTTPTAAESLRESLVALNHATAQLQRAGMNFNQAVAALNRPTARQPSALRPLHRVGRPEGRRRRRPAPADAAVIDKIRKGNQVAGLVYYLFGPGKSDEHRDQHMVAGWRDPSEVEPPFRTNGQRDFRYLISQLNAPLDAVGRNGGKDTVWHCVLSASPGDPLRAVERDRHRVHGPDGSRSSR